MNREIQDILSIQEDFVKGIKRNDFSFIKQIFTEDVWINCYMTGKGCGSEAVKRLLHYPGPKPAYVKQTVENRVTRYEKNQAQQSFHMLMLYTLTGEDGQFHFMHYGGTFILSYKKINKQWKISRILYDLCWLEGNSYWVKDWKMIDFHMPKRHKQIIDCKKDGVSHVIPVCHYERTDQEQIEETLFHYGWVIDTEDYELFRQIALSDVVVEDGYHGKMFKGVQNWTDFLTLLNTREPCLHHTYRVGEIQVNENRAVGKMSRIEPNRIGSKAIGNHNYFMDWFTLDYIVDLVKVSGVWKLKRINFMKNLRSIPAYLT